MHKQEMAYSVINIILIIITIGIIIYLGLKFINPTKYLSKTRDNLRLTGIESLQATLDLYIADGKSFSSLVPDHLYVSSSGSTVITGGGWLPLDLASVSSGVPIAVLPTDPINNEFFYYKVGINVANSTYEIDCRFENFVNNTKRIKDGGNNSDWYEAGTDLNILN